LTWWSAPPRQGLALLGLLAPLLGTAGDIACAALARQGLGGRFAQQGADGPVAVRVASGGGVVVQALHDVFQSALVGQEHGAALEVGEAVAGGPHHVDVAAAVGDAFFEDARSLR